MIVFCDTDVVGPFLNPLFTPHLSHIFFIVVLTHLTFSSLLSSLISHVLHFCPRLSHIFFIFVLAYLTFSSSLSSRILHFLHCCPSLSHIFFIFVLT